MYSWSMPAESSCSLGKRSLKMVVVMTILWLGFFLYFFCDVKTGYVKEMGVDNDNIKVGVVCILI